MNKDIIINCDCRDMLDQEMISTILENRGIKNVKHFLNPTKKDILPFGAMKNIDMGATIVVDGLNNKKKFMIHVDTDNDGVSSGVIIIQYLKGLGADVVWAINDRKEHGISDKLVEQLKKENPDILIIVDSLDQDINKYKEIKKYVDDIVVLDHHIVKKDIDYSEYVTLISSNVEYDNPELSGSGVVWKFCKYLDEKYIGGNNADLYVDLAMSGIIGDMVDLSEKSKENRAIVDLGLKNLHNKTLIALGSGFDFDSSTISFSVAPRINACNRLNENELAVCSMLETNDEQNKMYIRKLNGIKNQQNKEVDKVIDNAIEQVESQSDCKFGVVILENVSGLSGLIANQLMSIYQKPMLVLSYDNGKYSGSARGCGVDDFNKICTDTGLCSCAGHENAFGIIISEDKIELFKETLNEAMDGINFECKYVVDALIEKESVSDVMIDRVNEINRISGSGFKPLSFSITIDKFDVSDMSKGKHLVLRTDDMVFIKWNFKGNWEELIEASMFEIPVQCIGKLQRGFIGRKYYRQMIMDDFIL